MADNMEEDDDFGFFPAGSSRLSSLFPAQANNEEDVNQSLIYVAPKQPKKNEEQSTSNLGNLNLLHAVAAFTYKLENGKYCSHGKLGVAILGDRETAIYRLLLYKGKRQQITWCTININFKFTVEPKNYAKFPDDKGEQWSIKFSSEEQLVQFAKQVALAKANSSGKPPQKLVIQDLVSGEGLPADEGDSIYITYTGWLFKDFSFGEVFDENSKCEKPFVVRLGKSNVVKGLSEGLLGTKKSMKRLLIIPSDLGYGSKGFSTAVPPDQVLIFEAVVNKVKFSRDTALSPSHTRSDSEVKPDVPPRTQSVSEDSIRSRGASISEQLTQSPRKDNAKIISRMAKMGMATLPLQGAIAVQTSSESEAEKEVEHEHPKRIAESPKNTIVSAVQSEVQLDEVCRVPRRSISSPRTSSPHLQSNSVVYPTYPNAAVQGDSLPFLHQSIQAHPTASFITPVVPSLLESHIPILVSETRTQNTEVRLMLGKISDKLDAVMPKLDEIKSQGALSVHGQAPYLESSILAQNIERIIQENIQMKKENEAKSSKIHELNEKICDILQRNQRFFEESNSILEQRSDSLQMTASQLQNKILALEQEKVKLSAELSRTVSSLNEAQLQLHEAQRLYNELLSKSELCETNLKETKQLVDDLKTQNAEKEGIQVSLKADLEESKKKNHDLLLQLHNMEEKLRDAKDHENSLKTQLSRLSESAGTSNLKEVEKELQAKVEKVLQWKMKYETLLQNTDKLKHQYNTEIETLRSELKELKKQTTSQQVSQDFAIEMKKAMNILYKSLQTEVRDSQMYSSKDVLELTLNVIRRVTLRLIGMGQQHEQTDQKSSIRHPSPKNTVVHSSSKNIDTSSPKSAVDNSSLKDAVDHSSSECDGVPDADESSHNKHVQPSETEEKEVKTISSMHQAETASPKEQIQGSNTPEESMASLNSVAVDQQDETQTHPVINDSKAIADDDEISREIRPQEAQELSKAKTVIEAESKEPDGKATLVEEQSDSRKSPDKQESTLGDGAVTADLLTDAVCAEIWKPQPPTPPLFDDNEEEDEDDWLK